MDDRLLEQFRREYERRVRGVFEVASRRTPGVIPFIGGVYDAQDPEARGAAMKKTCQALVAQLLFEENAPDWAPTLPISSEGCEFLILSSVKKEQLFGYYVRSLRWTGYDYMQHPSLGVFGRGVMAAPRLAGKTAPLQDDCELRHIFFPPRALAGFSTRLMNWQAPGT